MKQKQSIWVAGGGGVGRGVSPEKTEVKILKYISHSQLFFHSVNGLGALETSLCLPIGPYP